MVADVEARLGKYIPDIALYHSDNTHYDLLVKEDSRLALLGFLAGAASGESKVEDGKKEMNDDVLVSNEQGEVDKTSDNDWKEVKAKNKKTKQNVEEILLEDVGPDDDNGKDILEEMVILGSKNNGHRRTNPQEVHEVASKKKQIFQCDQCESVLESPGLLQAHKSSQHSPRSSNACHICSDEFEFKTDLAIHVKEQTETNEWNCNDCAFHADIAPELMKHLKLSGHQPSQSVKDKRKVFRDFRECYTCKMAFEGYYNLMNHRKKYTHPTRSAEILKLENAHTILIVGIFTKMPWKQMSVTNLNAIFVVKKLKEDINS